MSKIEVYIAVILVAFCVISDIFGWCSKEVSLLAIIAILVNYILIVVCRIYSEITKLKKKNEV